MRLILAGFFFLSSLLAAAQTGTLTGKIFDKDSKEPLIGATILIEGTTLGGITDLKGSFTIKNIPVGKATIVVKYIGYEDVKQTATITEAQTTALEDVLVKSTAIGLSEVEVFANVVEDRKTPVAVSSIGSLIISEQLGGMQLPELLNATPGVYATQGDGSFGDAYINIRGFGQEEVLFMINGVPMNDMENGIMYWSNFAGLSEVTRSMQVQRGLGASKLAVNSVGGTVNIITDPSDRRKGGRAELTFAENGSYQNRYRLTLNSGLLKGGWSFTFQGSRSSGEGVRPGTYVDAWSYFLTASKNINDDHTLLFTIFGAPANRGRAFNSSTEAYERLNNYQHNIAAGYLRGGLLNTSQNKAHKPQMTLMHLWNINDRMTVTTSAYASIARVYGTSVQRGAGVSSVTSDLWGTSSLPVNNDGFLDLKYAYDQNVANTQTIQNPYGYPYGTSITGEQSKYILEARYNNHNWYGAISNLNYQINPTTTLVGGIDLRDYTASHFARVHDLLGGDFWLDVDRFTQDDNNMLTPNRIAYKGDKISYDYDGHVRWGSAFAQVEKTINQFDVFVSANVSRIQMWRVGNFWNGVNDDFAGGPRRYRFNSFGSSDKRVFENYNAKAGVNYRISGRHNVFVNGGLFTRAPFLRNAFEDARYTNAYLNGIKNERIQAAEVGYSYRTSKLRVNANAYYTQWKDKAFFSAFASGYVVDEQTGQRQAVTGIAAKHLGVELDARYEPIQGLELTGSVSVGDWEWSNNGNYQYTNDDTGETLEQNIYTKGVRVGNSAQTVAFIGAHYKRIRDTYFGFRFNYFGDLYEQFDPAERTEGFVQARKLPDYYILDIYGGYYFNISELRSRIGVNIHNLLNDNFIRRSVEFNGYNQEMYGFPINFNATLTVYF
jgi:iron complex outermembrane recepter protein